MKRVHVSGMRIGRGSVAVSLLGTRVPFFRVPFFRVPFVGVPGFLVLGFLGLGFSVAGLSGCEEEKPKPAPAVPSAVIPAAAVTPAKPKEPEKPKRPEQIDSTLTPQRRTEIEGAYADAKGFLVGTDIEEGLKKNKALKDKGPALKAFDKLAKGKWVLFSGPIVNLTDTGFDLGVTFTPRMENDPMGMSRQFFMVTLNSIEGYSKEAFKDGQVVVALAKYDGDAKASKGYELVATSHWK